jgi:hypothetical protein
MEFISPKEVSGEIKKSVRWVYSHADQLGGVKIGGSWIFSKEGLKNAIQTKQKVAGSGNISGQKVSDTLQNQKGGDCLGKSNSRRIGAERREAAKRHGLDDLL